MELKMIQSKHIIVNILLCLSYFYILLYYML